MNTLSQKMKCKYKSKIKALKRSLSAHSCIGSEKVNRMKFGGGQKNGKQKTIPVVWQSAQMIQEICRTYNRPRLLLKDLQNAGKCA